MKNGVKNTTHTQQAVTPYLVIQNAREAIEFYKKAFGATELCTMPSPDGLIMHAELKVNGGIIYLSDEFPQAGNRSPKSLGGTPVGIHLYVENADKVFNQAVVAGAKVTMPLMDMFWGDRFGKLCDPFGHEWSIAQHLEDVAPEEMQKRSAAAMAGFAKK